MWLSRKGRGMRAHRMPGAISIDLARRRRLGRREGQGAVVGLGEHRLRSPTSRFADIYPGMDYFALHLKVAQGRCAEPRGCKPVPLRAGGQSAQEWRMSEPTYRAVVCEELGPPDRLRLRRLPRAPLGPACVRVAVKAAGINFPDVLIIQGLYQHRPELPFVPGLEAAGVVAEVAADVSGMPVGDKVIARMRTGGYAEEAVVPASQVMPLPDGFSFAEGPRFWWRTSAPITRLETRAAIARGETLLVLGAAGGVGLAARAARQGAGRPRARCRIVAGEARGGCPAWRRRARSTTRGARRGRREAPHVRQGRRRRARSRGHRAGGGAAMRGAEGKLLIAGFAGGVIPAYAANRILLKGAR